MRPSSINIAAQTARLTLGLVGVALGALLLIDQFDYASPDPIGVLASFLLLVIGAGLLFGSNLFRRLD